MVNKAIVLGRLGQKPEIRYTQSGQAVVSLRVATTAYWKRDNLPQERTEWHTVVVWGRTAEACAQYLTKGSLVYVEGEIQSRQYETKTGEKRTAYEIKASDVKFMEIGNRGNENDNQVESHDAAAAAAAKQTEDLPF
jgi:single-strand DNA-binding protein